MKKRYTTSGIHTTIPEWLRNLLWYLWESIDEVERGDFQSFSITANSETLRVEHSQKQSSYHKVILIPSKEETICTKVIILEKNDSWIMMLGSEYEGGLKDE